MATHLVPRAKQQCGNAPKHRHQKKMQPWHKLDLATCHPSCGRIPGTTSLETKTRALCEPRKKTVLLSIESWLFNRDPYFTVY